MSKHRRGNGQVQGTTLCSTVHSLQANKAKAKCSAFPKVYEVPYWTCVCIFICIHNGNPLFLRKFNQIPTLQDWLIDKILSNPRGIK
jgi:hypothetical protein